MTTTRLKASMKNNGKKKSSRKKIEKMKHSGRKSASFYMFISTMMSWGAICQDSFRELLPSKKNELIFLCGLFFAFCSDATNKE